MRRDWDPEDLIGYWTLLDSDWQLVANKTGATRLGFVALLKFFEIEGRFPQHAAEVPEPAVVYLAEQVQVDPGLFAGYLWSGRTIEQHRAQIRASLGFRECSEADQRELTAWLVAEVCAGEQRREPLRDAVLAQCRVLRLEPPTFGQIARLVGSALTVFEKRFCTTIEQRLDAAEVSDRLEALCRPSPDTAGGGPTFLSELKADPGPLGVDTFQTEVGKLRRARALGVPSVLFDGWSERLVDEWRHRAARTYPSDLEASSRDIRLTLLAALCHRRTTEITDGLVDLLVQLVDKIDAKAERKVEKELLGELRKVAGKEGLLFRIAEAAVDRPDETVRAVIWPVAGPGTLRQLVAEAKANKKVFNAKVRTVLRSSYSHHYRRVLPDLLAALEFRSGNGHWRPVINALALLQRYKDVDVSVQPQFAAADVVPIGGVVPADWRPAVIDENGRVERIPYELCVLKALAAAIRRREIWIAGAAKWRNPDDDLPADFETNRHVHYAAIRAPLDGQQFVDDLKRRLGAALDMFNQALADGTTGGVKVTTRRGEPWLSIPTMDKIEEPANLEALKAEVQRRWGTIDLLDVLKEADFLTGFTGEFASVFTREALPAGVCAADFSFHCSDSGPTSGSNGSRTASPPTTTGERPITKRRCAGSARAMSPGTTCARRSASWSTPPWRCETQAGGATVPPAPRTRRSSGRGRRI